MIHLQARQTDMPKTGAIRVRFSISRCGRNQRDQNIVTSTDPSQVTCACCRKLIEHDVNANDR